MRPRLSITQAAYYLGMRERELIKYIRRGEIPSIRQGNSYFMSRSDIDAWWDQLPGVRLSDLPSQLPRTDPSQLSPCDFGYVYILKCGPYYKIGKTNKLSARAAQLEIQLPHKPKLIHSIRSHNPTVTEDELHEIYTAQRLNGEWFKLSKTDLLNLRTIKVRTDGTIDHESSFRFDGRSVLPAHHDRRSSGPRQDATDPLQETRRQTDLFDRRP